MQTKKPLEFSRYPSCKLPYITFPVFPHVENYPLRESGTLTCPKHNCYKNECGKSRRPRNRWNFFQYLTCKLRYGTFPAFPSVERLPILRKGATLTCSQHSNLVGEPQKSCRSTHRWNYFHIFFASRHI